MIYLGFLKWIENFLDDKKTVKVKSTLCILGICGTELLQKTVNEPLLL